MGLSLGTKVADLEATATSTRGTERTTHSAMEMLGSILTALQRADDARCEGQGRP
jgi:hypothetical protein